MSFATNLKWFMQKESMNEVQLAARLYEHDTGVNQQTVVAWLNGTTRAPRVETLHALSLIFGCAMEALLNSRDPVGAPAGK